MSRQFLKNALILGGGNLAVQVVTLLAAPLLTRLCTVEAFAAYTLYSSAIGMLSQAVCLKFDMALSLAHEENAAAGLLRLSVLATLCFAAGCVSLFPFAGGIGRLLGAADMRWLRLLPASALGCGLTAAFTAANIRAGRHGGILWSAVIRATLMAAAQVGLARAGGGAMALVTGQAIAYFPALLPLLPAVWRLMGRCAPHGSALVATARQYLAFPGYTTLGALFNSGAYHLTGFVLSALFSPTLLGYYALCVRVLSAPLTLFVSPMSQLFMRQLADVRSRGETGRNFCLRVVAVAAAPAVAGGLLLWVAAGWAIPFVFGDVWAGAVPIFRILLPLYVLRFVLVPVSGAAIVMGRQAETMIWQAGMALLILLPAVFFGGDIYAFLGCMVLCFGVGYIAFFAYTLTLMKQERLAEVRHG